MTTARPGLAPSVLALALLAATGVAEAQPGPSGTQPGGPSLRAPGGRTQAQAPDARSAEVAFQREAARTPDAIEVRSPQLREQAPIPVRHTAYGDGISPALEWTPVSGARSYVVLVEDPDAPSAQPFAHWVGWNIPAGTQALPAGIQAVAMPHVVPGMRQGSNDRRMLGYFGPRPPEGDGPHHYHFQVFALDRTLELSAGATRDQLLEAMHGHVIAKGELVATSEAPHGH